MRSPTTDPQPGDVVELVPGFVRHVTERRGDGVVYRSQLGTGLCCVGLGPFVDLLKDWTENVKDATVLHVAEGI